MELSRTRTFIARLFVYTLIFSLAVPLPIAGHAAGQDADANAARVHARLNSAERKAAIARAAEIDAAAREEYAKSEVVARGEGGGIISPPSPLALSPSTPHNGVDGKSAALAPSTHNAGQGASGPLQGDSKEGQRPSLAAGGTSSPRPKSITEVLFNAATGMVGLPGLAGNQHDPYDPNADQGLGFHADGTARRADGTTGTNAASAGYNGKRAASYANHGAGYGLGYSPYANGQYGYNEPGYDPTTGHNFRYGDPTNGGRRTNGQGGYGNLDQFDPARMMLDHGLNYGLGLANSAAEGLFLGVMDSPYGGARARFNFMVDWDGNINGEGDLLLPWYDSKYTTVYSQFGARTMNQEDSRDRWIGNFGLGQRWYPYAMNDGTGEDAGTLMLGYNAFFDNDFTRSHQRGGLGIEGQYDWLHLASNYYFPLSSWKNSKDFDGDFVKERAAEGWDIRAKGYLPFYRNLALTGAYTQWYGDNVGMFGAGHLERDPKVWSYGLEYTPIPLVSGFVNQRSTEHGRSDTELGLRFTYNFQMPWEDQIRHDKVAELRTVGGSRHEFVDRENRIILEYKAKNNHRVEFVGRSNDVFTFRIRNGFGNYVAGQTVQVSATGVTTLAAATTAPATFLAQVMEGAGEFLGSIFSVSAAYAADFFNIPKTSGPDGTFSVTITGLNASSRVTIQGGEASSTFTAAELGGGGASSYDITYVSGHQGTLAQSNTMTMVYNVAIQSTSDPAPDGTTVKLLAQTQSGSGTAQKLEVASGTVASGQVSLVFDGKSGSTQDGNSFLARSIVLYGASGASESAASSVVAVGTIPAANTGSFLTGSSGSGMTWSDANNFCAAHGGKLPLFNGQQSLPYPPPPRLSGWFWHGWRQ